MCIIDLDGMALEARGLAKKPAKIVPANAGCPIPAVFISKQDLEPPGRSSSRDAVTSFVLPLPAQVRTNNGAGSSSGTQGRLSAGEPSSGGGGWPPPPRRRTRSASARTPPDIAQFQIGVLQSVQQPPQAIPMHPKHLVIAAAWHNQQAGGSPTMTDQDKIVCLRKPMRVIRAKTVAARMDRISPEPSTGPVGTAIAAGGVVLELHGYNDPRRIPRPTERGCDKKLVASGSPPPAVLTSHTPSANAPITVPFGAGMPLQVSRLASVQPSQSTAPAEVEDLAAAIEAENWTASEADEDAGSDSGDFNYQRYRYRDQQAKFCRAASLEPVRKRPPPRRPVGQAIRSGPEDGSSFCAWSSEASASSTRPLSRIALEPSTTQDVLSDISTPRCDIEEADAELLRRVGDVLVRFYGLGELETAIRFKSSALNVVIVAQEAWAKRQRESQLDEPPMLWVRGGRVYDFHGDRGTVAEFENDLLQRQVEDDMICRQRRREQGLMPFPFVALPLKSSTAEDPDDFELAREGPATRKAVFR